MDGWTSHVDPKTKRMYYHHAESNKTQWTTPNDIPSNKKTPSLQDLKRKTLPPCATASVMKLDAILSDLPHAKTECTWKKYWNTEYDRYYYHHASKDITTWTKPKEYEEDDLFVALPTELVSEKIKQEKKDALKAMEKSASSSDYTSVGKFNTMTGRFDANGGDTYWKKKGLSNDRAGRQMNTFFDPKTFEKNREGAKKRKMNLQKDQSINWKAYEQEKKNRKKEKTDAWIYDHGE